MGVSARITRPVNYTVGCSRTSIADGRGPIFLIWEKLLLFYLNKKKKYCLSKCIGLWSEIIFRPKSLVQPQRPMELLAPSYPGNTLPPSPSAARHPTSQWCQIYHSLPPRIPTATTADITSALQMYLGRNQLSVQNVSYSCSNIGTIGFDPVATLHYYPSATTAATSRASWASTPSATSLPQHCITTLLQPPQMYLGRNQLSAQNVSYSCSNAATSWAFGTIGYEPVATLSNLLRPLPQRPRRMLHHHRLRACSHPL